MCVNLERSKSVAVKNVNFSDFKIFKRMTSKEEETKPADSMIGENSDVVMKQRMTKLQCSMRPGIEISD